MKKVYLVDLLKCKDCGKIKYLKSDYGHSKICPFCGNEEFYPYDDFINSDIEVTSLEELEEFQNKNYSDKNIEDILNDMEDVPINEKEEIDEDFYIWKKGTHRERIWQWIDQKHSKGLYYLI